MDARKLTDTGIGRYSSNLIQELARLDDENEYFLLIRTTDLQSVPALPSNFHIVPTWSKNYSIRELWELSSQAIRLRPDVLHSLHYVVPLIKRSTSIVTIHDTAHLRFPNQLLSLSARVYTRIMIRIAAATATAVITVSQASKQEIMRLLKVPAKKVTVVPEAPSPIFRIIAEEAGCRDVLERFRLVSTPFIVYIGMWKPHKNLVGLLRAFKLVVSRNKEPGLKLVIVGRRDPRYSEVLAEIDRLQLGAQVILTGSISDEELVCILNAARLLVQPSFYEGFGLPVLEAMACGTPVVSSNAASLPEVVGDAGLLVDPHDVEGMAEAIEMVLTDSRLWHELRQRGLARAQMYSWQETAKQTLEIYRSLSRR